MKQFKEFKLRRSHYEKRKNIEYVAAQSVLGTAKYLDQVRIKSRVAKLPLSQVAQFGDKNIYF